jgi:hypothetical protein
VTEVANQGAVTGSNFTDLLTDDPDTTEADDPTVTQVDVPDALMLYLPIMVRDEPPAPVPTTPTVPIVTRTPTNTPVTPQPPGPTNTPTPTTQPVNAPDLVVTSLTISPDKRNFAAGESVIITAEVTNQGTVRTNGSFWVDMYINPTTPPTASDVPIRWDDDGVCGLQPCFGIAWGVNNLLDPGESVTLTSESYLEDFSIWPGWLASGTTDIYIYVDGWGETNRAAIPESNEANNRAHLDGLTVTGENPPLLMTQPDLPLDRPLEPPPMP